MKLVIKKKTSEKTAARLKKKIRVRKKIFGTEERPRLTVYKSLKHFYAQVVNDVNGTTLASFSTLQGDLKASGKEAAVAVGREIAKLSISKNVKTVVFDRNGYNFHGKIKAMVDAAREAGLKF